MERKHLLDGLKKCWGLPLGEENVYGDGVAEPALAEGVMGVDPAGESELAEPGRSRDGGKPSDANEVVESTPAGAGTRDNPVKDFEVVESDTAAVGTRDGSAELEESELPGNSTEQIFEVVNLSRKEKMRSAAAKHAVE